MPGIAERWCEEIPTVIASSIQNCWPIERVRMNSETTTRTKRIRPVRAQPGSSLMNPGSGKLKSGIQPDSLVSMIGVLSPAVVVAMFLTSALDADRRAGLDLGQLGATGLIRVDEQAADHLGTRVLAHDLQALGDAVGRI